mmetsp:Transcript_4819/g.16046  ORF Transcript_4819/g.16046 Transcript_4819/m.16046 type:complete len:273 (-) Transcript_4819:447-1265(-)
MTGASGTTVHFASTAEGMGSTKRLVFVAAVGSVRLHTLVSGAVASPSGTCPVRELRSTVSATSCTRFPSSDGNVPSSWLSCMRHRRSRGTLEKVGSVPVRLLVSTVSVRRLGGSAPASVARAPLRELLRSSRARRTARPEASEGSVPCRLLCPRLRYARLVESAPSCEGSAPVSEWPSRRSVTQEVRPDSSVGRLPVMEPLKTRRSRPAARRPNSVGTGPAMCVAKRSRISRADRDPISVGMDDAMGMVCKYKLTADVRPPSSVGSAVCRLS